MKHGLHIPLDTDDEGKLGLFVNVETATLPGQSTESDLLTLCITVFLDIGLGALEDRFALLLVVLHQRC